MHFTLVKVKLQKLNLKPADMGLIKPDAVPALKY